MVDQAEASALVMARCQRNGCTAEVLVGRTKHGTTVVLDARSERRAVVHRVVLRDLNDEVIGTDRRIVMEDTYRPHRYSCASRVPAPETSRRLMPPSGQVLVAGRRWSASPPKKDHPTWCRAQPPAPSGPCSCERSPSARFVRHMYVERDAR